MKWSSAARFASRSRRDCVGDALDGSQITGAVKRRCHVLAYAPEYILKVLFTYWRHDQRAHTGGTFDPAEIHEALQQRGPDLTREMRPALAPVQTGSAKPPRSVIQRGAERFDRPAADPHLSTAHNILTSRNDAHGQ
jgi:hypothetical protein